MIVWATSGAAVLVLLPMLVGGFVDYLGFSGTDLALLAAADMLGAAFGTLIISPKVDKINIKKTATISIIIMVVGNLLSIGITGVWILFIIRIFCGLGQGISMGAACAVMSHTEKPDRAIALFVVAALLFGAVGLYVLPYILSSGGLDYLYICLAIVATASLVCIFWLPKHALAVVSAEDTSNDSSDMIKPVMKWMAVLGVLAYFMAQGSVWAYIERMGVEANISMSDIGLALGICSIFGAAGGLTAAVLDIRFGRFAPLTVAAIISVVGLMILLTDFNLLTYTIAASMFNYGWNYTYPYQLTAIRSVDPTARLVSIAVAMQTFGLAIGPVIAGMLISEGDYEIAKWMGIIFIICALLMLAPTSRYADRRLQD